MSHIFDIHDLEEIVRPNLGRPVGEQFQAITEDLVARYGDHITPEHRWMFNNAGGAMGTLTILHASLSEYLLFFGSAIGTEGHSGRYGTEIWDIMLAGRMLCYHEDTFEPRIFKPGDTAYLGSGQVKGYKLPDTGGWMLEYSRGFIPAMLPFGLADTVLSTLDTRTLVKTVGRYGKGVVKELLKGKI